VRVSAHAAPVIDAYFLDGSRGRLATVEIAPARGARSHTVVLCCPPFAEEMNRTRRAVQLAARRMTAHGCTVLLADPYGTGDSEGDFGAATWEGWRDDLQAVAAWARAQRASRVALWGVRLGAVLALELAPALSCEHLLLWQPVAKGAVFLNQFLRLRVAADMLAADGASSVEALRAELAGGGSVEIAGYTLSPALARAVDGAELEALAGRATPPIDWLEAVANAERPLAPASRALLERWQAAGVRVQPHAAVALPFWSTAEIVVPESFLEHSERIVQAWVQAEQAA
jgi:exosortase A-associated hydrolase 2